MNSQSNTQRQDAADHEISGLEPIQDSGLVGPSPDAQIHKTKTGDPDNPGRSGENESARVDPVENNTNQDNHNSSGDIPRHSNRGRQVYRPSSQARRWSGGPLIMMRRGSFERIKPEENSGKSVRFAFLPFLKPKRARVHWLMTETGMVCRFCLKRGDTPGYCSFKLGEKGQYRVVAMAIEYTNADSTGDYPSTTRVPLNGGSATLH